MKKILFFLASLTSLVRADCIKKNFLFFSFLLAPYEDWRDGKIILNYKDFFLIKNFFNEYILLEKEKNSEGRRRELTISKVGGKVERVGWLRGLRRKNEEYFLLYSKLIITKRGPLALFFNFSFRSFHKHSKNASLYIYEMCEEWKKFYINNLLKKVKNGT